MNIKYLTTILVLPYLIVIITFFMIFFMCGVKSLPVVNDVEWNYGK